MDNRRVVLDGHRLRLVAYLPHHVPRYHEWMTNPRLLALTCSEPLSLQEEVENQVSWLESSDKLTFIILAPRLNRSTGRLLRQDETDPTPGGRRWEMVGDCNAFIGAQEPDVAEVEVSVSESTYRRLGVASEAIQLLMGYLATVLGKTHFEAKILSSNTASIALFRDVLGFTLHREVKVFDEVHFRRQLDPTDAAGATATLLAACGYRASEYVDREQAEGPCAVEVSSTWADRAARVVAKSIRLTDLDQCNAEPLTARASDEFVGAVVLLGSKTGAQWLAMHSRTPTCLLVDGRLVPLQRNSSPPEGASLVTLNAALCDVAPFGFPFPDEPFTNATSSSTVAAAAQSSPVDAEADVASLPEDEPLTIGRGYEKLPEALIQRWLSFLDAPLRRQAYARGVTPKSTVDTVAVCGSSEEGYLTKAAKDIANGTILWQLAGVAVPMPTTFTLELGEGRHVLFSADAQCMAHLCEPNLSIVPRDEAALRFDVVAARDIRAGEVIGFDYNRTEWAMSEAFQCWCCATPKFIQGFSHLPEDSQAALLPLAAPWIQRRVAARSA